MEESVDMAGRGLFRGYIWEYLSMTGYNWVPVLNGRSLETWGLVFLRRFSIPICFCLSFVTVLRTAGL